MSSSPDQVVREISIPAYHHPGHPLIPVGAVASKTSNTIGGPEVISEVFPDESDSYQRARGNGYRRQRHIRHRT
jgi:hypothetical protein